MSHRRALLAALALTLLVPAAQAEPGKARLNYLQYCSGCHQVDGSGLPASAVPSMRGTLGQFLQVRGGREYIVQVPGVMNSPLSDAQVAELMNWLLPAVSAETLPRGGVTPYTAAEVSRLRASRPVDVMGARQRLVTEIAATAVPSQ